MPGQHCPACGAVPTAAGCACSPHPDLEETAVLPHIEGPPLVRPYISAATSMSAQEPFATTLLPPIQPAPPYEPERYEQRPHEQRPHEERPYEQRPYEQSAYIPEPRQAPVRELGVFEVQHSGGGRAERRAQQQQDSPGRRRAVILAAGAGIAALGAGLAFVLSPSSDGGHSTDQAIPLPVGSYQPATTTGPPSASATPSPSTSASASPSRTTATRKPSASRAPVVAITPKPTPTTSSAAPSASPSSPSPAPQPTPRTLQLNDSGEDVAELQDRLSGCGYDYVAVTGTYDSDTRDAVRSFQRSAHIRGDAPGVYGPNTRSVFEQVC